MKRTVFPLPLTLEEIDAEWVTAALRTRNPDITVRACEMLDVNRGTCTKIRLRLDLDEAGAKAGIPPTVILKGGFEPHSRAMASMHDAEVHGYKDILPTLGLLSPRPFFAEFDETRRQGIVIMEDLVASGVTFCNPLKPQGQDEVARRLSVLARFHAKTWNSPIFAKDGEWSWLHDTMVLTNEYAGPYLEPDTWNRFIASPRGAAASVRFHDGKWMADALDRLAFFRRKARTACFTPTLMLEIFMFPPTGNPAFSIHCPRTVPA